MNSYFPIPTRLRTALLVALAALAGHGAMAAESPANKLQNVEVQSLSGKGLQIVLTTSGPAAEPVSFTIDNPARSPATIAKGPPTMSGRRTPSRSIKAPTLFSDGGEINHGLRRTALSISS